VDAPGIALTEATLQKAYGVPVHVVEIGAQQGIKMVVPSEVWKEHA